MTKKEFISRLKQLLSGLPKREVEERILFYVEMIDDRMEEGADEEEAVSLIGNVEEIAEQIAAGFTILNGEKYKNKPRGKLSAGEIVLLAVGSPVWISLLVTAFAVGISIYAVVWSAVLSLWAVFGSFAVCFLGGVLAGVVFVIGGNTFSGIAVLGMALISAGLSIFSFYGCKTVTAWTVILTKSVTVWIKRKFKGKGVYNDV